MSLEGGDGGQPSNVSRQVITSLWICDGKGSRSEGSANARYVELNVDETCQLVVTQTPPLHVCLSNTVALVHTRLLASWHIVYM